MDFSQKCFRLRWGHGYGSHVLHRAEDGRRHPRSGRWPDGGREFGHQEFGFWVPKSPATERVPMWRPLKYSHYRIHGAGIYANMDPINITPHVSIYTSTMDPSWDMNCVWKPSFLGGSTLATFDDTQGYKSIQITIAFGRFNARLQMRRIGRLSRRDLWDDHCEHGVLAAMIYDWERHWYNMI